MTGGALALSALLVTALLAWYIQRAKQDIDRKGIGEARTLRVTKIRPSLSHMVEIHLECAERSADGRSWYNPNDDVTLFLYPWLESYRSSKH